MTHHLPPYLASFAHFYPPSYHPHPHPHAHLNPHHQATLPHSAPPTQGNFPFSQAQAVFALPPQLPYPSSAYPPASFAQYHHYRPNFALPQPERLVPFEPDPDAEGESEVEPNPPANNPSHSAQRQLDAEVDQSHIELSEDDSDREWVSNKKKRPASKASTKAKSKKAKSKASKAKSKKPKVRAPPRGRNAPSHPAVILPGAPAGSFAPLPIPAGSAETEEDSSILFSLSPSRPPVTLRGVRRPVLPPPPGAMLEIAGLLILHPPSLDKDAKREPINQYSGTHYSNDTAKPPSGPGGPTEWKSQFEMYTCRLCMKTYDGRNARSVARRHLQDKHGLPLSMQGRRSRWDQEKDRPKDAEEVRERGLRSKRDWAAKHRQQMRLERAHSDFLSLFGPLGLTLDGVRLVAPHLRGTKHIRGRWLDGTTAATTGTIEVPSDLLEGVKAIQSGHLAGGLQSPQEEQDAQIPQSAIDLAAAEFAAESAGAEQIGDITELDYAQLEQLSWAYGQYDPALPIDESLPSATSTIPLSQPPSATQKQHELSAAGSGQWAIDAIPHLTALDRTHRSVASTSTAAPSPVSTISIGPSPASAAAAVHPGGQVWVSSTGWTPAPSRWQPPSRLAAPTPANATPKQTRDEPCEAVAAESLLNLHSTPLRPDSDSVRSTRTKVSTVRSSLTRPQVRLGHLSASTDTRSSTTKSTMTAHTTQSSGTLVSSSGGQHRGTLGKDKHLDPQHLLAAAEITARPRAERSRSFVQPFARSRPESLTRSLSFSMTPTIEADDPFIDHPPPTAGQSRGSAKAKMDASPEGEGCDSPSTHLAKRRKTISATTASLSLGLTGGAAPQRRPLQPLEPNAACAASTSTLTAKDKNGFSFGASAFGLTPLSKAGTPKTVVGSAMRESLRDFATPLRQMVKEDQKHPPSSDPVAKWLVSSPARDSPDKLGERTAVRLGLGVGVMQDDMRRVMGTPLERMGGTSRVG